MQVPATLTIIFQVLATFLLVLLRFCRVRDLRQITLPLMWQEPGVRRRTFFRAFTAGSKLALGTVGILNGRALVENVLTFPGGFGGLLTAFLLAIILLIVLYFAETAALAQIDHVPDEEVWTALRGHFLLGLLIPWAIGSAMVFVALMI